jgi:peptidyl-dipeptidase Dcp
MADEANVYLELKTEEDKAGLPLDLVSAAEQAARERNVATTDGSSPCIITLSRSLVEPFLTYSTRRDLREKAWRLWTKRGELNEERINYPLAVRMLELRNEQARMHGYTSFAAFSTVDTMAGSPQRVMELLEVLCYVFLFFFSFIGFVLTTFCLSFSFSLSLSLFLSLFLSLSFNFTESLVSC